MTRTILGCFFYVLNMAMGIFLIVKPVKAIKIQKKFYESINWKMIPISFRKEIRHTQIMGIAQLIGSSLVFFYFLLYGGPNPLC
jgi:hypothetical protein